jgi:peroxiredoxin
MTDTLNAQLSALTDELGVPGEVTELISAEVASVDASGLAQGLRVGDLAPHFALPDATGSRLQLSDLLMKGPVVLSFYRGEWCPYCNLELRTWQERQNDITTAGGQLVAISPQRPSNALSLTEKHGLAFPVLGDTEQEAIRAYRLRFDVSPTLKELFTNAFGLDLTTQNADGSWSLPVAATFVVDADQRIRFAYATADWRKRAEPREVIDTLRAMR